MKFTRTILSAALLTTVGILSLSTEGYSKTTYRACYGECGDDHTQVGACFTQSQVGANNTSYGENTPSYF